MLLRIFLSFSPTLTPPPLFLWVQFQGMESWLGLESYPFSTSSFLPPLLLPSSASLLPAPTTLSLLRGSEFPSVAPATQATGHPASGTHNPASHPGVPHGLQASISGQAGLWRDQK